MIGSWGEKISCGTVQYRKTKAPELNFPSPLRVSGKESDPTSDFRGQIASGPGDARTL